MLNKYLIICICFNLIVSFSIAKCPKQVQFLDKNERSPCRGYLFSPEKEKVVYHLNEEINALREEMVLKNKIAENYKLDILDLEKIVQKRTDQTQIWENRAIESTEKFYKSQANRGTRDFILFGAGVLSAILIGFGVAKIAGK